MARPEYSSPAVESAAKELEKAFERAFRQLRNSLRSEIAALNREGDILVRDQFNMRQIRSIVNNLKRRARELGFDDIFDKEADGLIKSARSIIDEAGRLGLSTEFTETTGIDLENLIFDAQRTILHHENVVVREIEKILMRSATGNLAWDDLVRRIEKRMGIRQDQALTAANDAIQTFHTHTRVEHFTEAGIVWWLYDGPEGGPIREFCDHFVGTRVTMEILDDPQWQIAFSGRGGHPLPPSDALGGYNCRHELVPLVDLAGIPIGPR